MAKAKIVASVWFNSIGIVIIDDKYSGHKAYIGVGGSLQQETDEQRIATSGTPFPIKQAKELCGVK